MVAQAAPIVVNLQEEGGLPHLDCSFDGVAQRCLLDSGSFVSVVHDVPPFDRYAVSRIVADSLKLVKVSSVTVAGNQVGPLHAIRDSHPFPTIGADVVCQRRLALRPGSPTRLIFNPDEVERYGLQSLEIDRDQRFVVSVRVNDQVMRALWDTGTAETRIVQTIVDVAEPMDFKRGDAYRYRRESGQRVRARVINIAGQLFDDLPVLTTGRNFSGGVEVLLGWDLISQLDWYFDPSARMWSARRPSIPSDVNPARP